MSGDESRSWRPFVGWSVGVSAAAVIAIMRKSSPWMPVSLWDLLLVLSECGLALVYVN
jgi:hypothetical protein